MKIHYKGKYNNDPDLFPEIHYRPGSTIFEHGNLKKKNISGVLTGILLMAILFLISYIIYENWFEHSIRVVINYLLNGDLKNYFISIIPLIILLIESFVLYFFVQLIFYKNDVYVYRFGAVNFFVLPVVTLTKAKYIASLTVPSIVITLPPYLIGMLIPGLRLFILSGMLAVTVGGLDLLSAVKAFKKIPKGAMVYYYGLDTYWYMP